MVLTVDSESSGVSAIEALDIVDKLQLFTWFSIDGKIFVVASSTVFSMDGVRICVAELMSSFKSKLVLGVESCSGSTSVVIVWMQSSLGIPRTRGGELETNPEIK